MPIVLARHFRRDGMLVNLHVLLVCRDRLSVLCGGSLTYSTERLSRYTAILRVFTMC